MMMEIGIFGFLLFIYNELLVSVTSIDSLLPKSFTKFVLKLFFDLLSHILEDEISVIFKCKCKGFFFMRTSSNNLLLLIFAYELTYVLTHEIWSVDWHFGCCEVQMRVLNSEKWAQREIVCTTNVLNLNCTSY